MDIVPKKAVDFLIRISIFIFLIFSLFISCEQADVEIRQVEYSVVFEYEDEKSFPDAKLCVFVESTVNSARNETIQVTSLKNKYIWDSKKLVKLNESNRFWSGYTNFVMPDNKPFPNDLYKIKLENADEKNNEIELKLSYDQKFYSLKAESARDKLREMHGVKKIAIYNREGLLIYFGTFSSNLSSKERIKNTYSSSYYYNEIWESRDKSVICILPKQYLISDENLLN